MIQSIYPKISLLTLESSNMTAKNLNFSKDSGKNKKDKKFITFANIASKEDIDQKFGSGNPQGAKFDKRNQLLSRVGARQSANVDSSARAYRSVTGERMSLKNDRGSHG